MKQTIKLKQQQQIIPQVQQILIKTKHETGLKL